MNRQEINEMMKDLPSQQPPQETLGEKIFISVSFIAVIALLCMVTDIVRIN
jgi:hypothetical protein